MPDITPPNYSTAVGQVRLLIPDTEQLEDPKSVKGIVKRGVTQIVSPGMPYDLDKTVATENAPNKK